MKNYVLVTLDSCRYDAFEQASTPNFNELGRTFKCFSHGDYTLPSHMSIFKGILPEPLEDDIEYISHSKRLFKLRSPNMKKFSKKSLVLDGEDIIEGFCRMGYRTIGTGGVDWFDPKSPGSSCLIKNFHKYGFFGEYFYLKKQVDFLYANLQSCLTDKKPFFMFCNVGETHIPYWNDESDAPQGFNIKRAKNQNADEARRRQINSIEFADRYLGRWLCSVKGSMDICIIVTADHGDCWGEDGLWGHSICHHKVHEVPMIIHV